MKQPPNKLENIQSWKQQLIQVIFNPFLGKAERDSSVNQVKMAEALQKQFKSRYEDTLKKAQDV